MFRLITILNINHLNILWFMNFMKFGFTDQQYNFKCHFFDLLLISGKISGPKIPPTSVLLFAQKKIVHLYKNEPKILKVQENQQHPLNSKHFNVLIRK